MTDWVGLFFILFLIVGAYFGLRVLGRSRVRTAEEFERSADESASLIGAGVNALHGILNPEAAKGNEVVRELKIGTHGRKRAEGKSVGKKNGENND